MHIRGEHAVRTWYTDGQQSLRRLTGSQGLVTGCSPHLACMPYLQQVNYTNSPNQAFVGSFVGPLYFTGVKAPTCRLLGAQQA